MIAAAVGVTIASVFILTALVALVLFIYFIPTTIAAARKHHQVIAIGALNLFLGWTFIGWLGALVWALTNPPPAQQIIVQQYGPPPTPYR